MACTLPSNTALPARAGGNASRSPGPAAAAEPAISFTRDIKGILSNRCIRCHGPDAEDRHGGGDEGLRLDTFEGATEPTSAAMPRSCRASPPRAN